MIKRRSVSISILACFLVVFSFFLVSCFNVSSGTYTGGHDKIGLLRVEGVIASGENSGNPFGGQGAFSDSIIAALKEAEKNESIKAVVIRVNSPGGSAAASEEIFNAIKEVKDAGKPVVVSMADIAASGGYFISAAATKIYADATTLTGSIGVIMELPMVQGLLNDILKVDMRTLKSGEHKDIGSPFRPMTDEEKAIFQTMLDQTHDVFINYVAQGRGMDVEKVRAIATGMIFTGQQAKENGLVDEIGGLRDAIKKAAELSGITGEPVIEELGKTNILDQLLGMQQQASTSIPNDQLALLSQYLFLNPVLANKEFAQLYR